MHSDRFWIFLLLCLTAPVYFLTLRDDHHWGGDFAVYLQQAANVAHGEPIQAHQYTVTPRSALNHPALYPPIPSLLLAPVYASAGLDYRLLKVTLALCWWLALPLWYLVGLRMALPRAWSAGAILTFALGSLPLGLKETIGSDGVYVFTSAAALLLILRVDEAGWTVRQPAITAALVAALLCLNYATRATAVALLTAAVLSELWQKRGLRAYGLYLVAFLAAGLLVYTKFIFDTGGQYGTQFVIDWRLYLENALFYFRMPASLWSSSPMPLRYALAGLVTFAGVVSVIRAWRRPTVIEFYLVFFCGMLVLYVVADFRYSLPILPPLLLLAARLWIDYAPKPATVGLAALVAIAAALNLQTAVMAGTPEAGPRLATFGEVAGFLRQAPPGTVSLSWNPRLFAYYTQRPSALYPRTPEEWAREIPFLVKKESTQQFYLVVYRHELDQRQLASYFAGAGSKLIPVFKNSDFTVYRLPA